jgi:Protein of unknown function (DUF2905)
VRSYTQNMEVVGRALFFTGLAFLVLGAMLWGLARTSNFGRLPGDLSFSGDNLMVYIPIASMVIISIVLTVALNLVIHFLR